MFAARRSIAIATHMTGQGLSSSNRPSFGMRKTQQDDPYATLKIKDQCHRCPTRERGSKDRKGIGCGQMPPSWVQYAKVVARQNGDGREISSCNSIGADVVATKGNCECEANSSSKRGWGRQSPSAANTENENQNRERQRGEAPTVHEWLIDIEEADPKTSDRDGHANPLRVLTAKPEPKKTGTLQHGEDDGCGPDATHRCQNSPWSKARRT